MRTTAEGRRAAALWAFAVVAAYLPRWAAVRLLDVWTADGRLAIRPEWFTALNAAPVALAGALYFLLFYQPAAPRAEHGRQ